MVGEGTEADLYVDAVRIGIAAPEATLELAPGAHVIELRDHGVTLASQDVEIEAGHTREVELVPFEARYVTGD